MTAAPPPVVPVWLELPEHRRWLDRESLRLLDFAHATALPDGGAAYLDDDGNPDPAYGTQTWITCRMVHSYALGHMMGIPGCGAIAAEAIKALNGGVLYDAKNGGWYHAVDAAGNPDIAAGKTAYDHAFVMLAGASATLAGIPGGAELLNKATETYLDKFWDEKYGRPIDTWNVDFTHADEYRGVNATMHSVEAMLSVADAVPPDQRQAWLDRATRCVEFVAQLAKEHDGRLPEHFDSAWQPELELNQDRPDDQFKPYGATPGHGLEWARLILHLEAATGRKDLLDTARVLFDRAVADGWAADGADGFVYTTDWTGKPVVQTRMHWVVCEAIAAAAALYERTREQKYADWYALWWDYAERHLIDRKHGSWHHELDPENNVAANVWPGKPDIYHALQCTLIPRLPLTPMLPAALNRGLLKD